MMPDDRLPLLPGRPPLATRGLWYVRFWALLLRPLLILWLLQRQHSAEARVNSKLDKVGDCRGRKELEELLGRPLYAVSGEVVDTPEERPDLIERTRVVKLSARDEAIEPREAEVTV